MKAILLVSQKTFSLSKMMPITVWHQKDIELEQLKMPKDFEERAVNAALNDKRLSDEFKELNFDWSTNNKIWQEAMRFASTDEGLTDIAVFIDNIKIGKVIKAHSNKRYDLFKAESVDEVKNELT